MLNGEDATVRKTMSNRSPTVRKKKSPVVTRCGKLRVPLDRSNNREKARIGRRRAYEPTSSTRYGDQINLFNLGIPCSERLQYIIPTGIYLTYTRTKRRVIVYRTVQS